MNPYGQPPVVVVNGRVTDDGNFFTQNGQPVPLRAFAVYRGGELIAGAEPPRRWPKEGGLPGWMLTRVGLAALDLALLVSPGEAFLRLWGGVDSDPEWYEIGSGNPQDNGATDVVIGTSFTIGPPAPGPRELLRRGVERLERSDAYRRNFSNVVAGTKDCRRALDLLG